MALAFGNKVISKAYFGEKAVSAIYLGTKKVFPTEEEELPGTGDIRLRIQTTSANQSFPLFRQITTESGGYVTVDWGDGNTETFTGSTTYQPTHTYATAGEYIVKLTGSKFTRMNGDPGNAYDDFQDAIREILSLKMPTDSTSVSLDQAFYECTNLTGNIPTWDNCITTANSTYYLCTGLTGEIPAWGANIVSAIATYTGCTRLTGSIPAWGANITDVSHTYYNCTGLTGNIPEWGANIVDAESTYETCTGLTGCSKELLQDPMPSRITLHTNCVAGCVDEIRQHFTPEWGGTKAEAVEYIPGTGDIRLRIQTPTSNQSFQLFKQITTKEGGYVSVDWGDGNKVTFTSSTVYQPTHTYATAGEYVVKLTGSKFTGVIGSAFSDYDNFRAAIREIISLKMPTDSMYVSLNRAFDGCQNLTGSIPEWDDCITRAEWTYSGCKGLTGRIPKWGANIWSAYRTYYACTGLTGSIPAWGANITDASFTYLGCTGLTGRIPKWGEKITDANGTYRHCTGLTGSIPAWGANITDASFTYLGCVGLTGNIPEWGANIRYAEYTYAYCDGLTGCSAELLQDPMPSRITSHADCVAGCQRVIRRHFTEDWGGTKTS